MPDPQIGELLRRTRRDSAVVARRWARASLTAAPGMARHRLLWVAHRRLGTWEAPALPDADRPLPGERADVQGIVDGVGLLHRRTYAVRFATSALPDEVVAGLGADLDAGTPDLFVRFLGPDRGPPTALDVGDEVLARLTSPVDGPVRVAEVRPDGLRLITLRGHAEAGEIDFSVVPDGPGHLRFTVCSWARSGNALVRLLYERGGGRDVQAHVWTHLCLAVARRHGTPVGRVAVADRTDAWPLEG